MQLGSPDTRVYDSRGEVPAALMHCAPRASTLAGKRLAILDNTKWNANKLLRGTRDKLVEQAGFSVVTYYRKESFSLNAAPEFIGEICANNDLVLTAIGDSGSLTEAEIGQRIEEAIRQIIRVGRNGKAKAN